MKNFPDRNAICIFFSTGSCYRVKRSRSNISWLRKSMKRLKSFQLPSLPINHQQTESSTSTPPTQQPESTQTNLEKESLNHEEEDIQNTAPVNQDMNFPALIDSSGNPDIFNVVLQQSQQCMSESRPRQYGRRSNPVRVSSSIEPETVSHATAVSLTNFVINFSLLNFKSKFF